MSNISMLSEITPEKGSAWCSLGICIFVVRDLCKAARDWVGSCAIIIARRREGAGRLR
jgi:hypothetical protein